MRADMAKVLTHYGILRRSSNQQMVRCLLHGDTTPSMSVNLTDGLFFCHACGESGTALQLVAKIEGVDLDGAGEFAAANGLGGEALDDSDGAVHGGFGHHSALARSKGDRHGGRKYVPPRLRRRSDAGA